jgi:hypothetical protein
MSEITVVADVRAIGTEEAVLATRLVKRRCGPDAPAVLAILGLDTVSTPAPPREAAQRAVPNPFRRTTKGKGRR